MPVQNNSREEALNQLAAMRDSLAQVIMIAQERMAFNKRYRDYCTSCSEDEYAEFVKSFLPQIPVDSTTLITAEFPQFTTKEKASAFFQYTMAEYVTIVVACKKIYGVISAEVNDEIFDDVKKELDKGFFLEKKLLKDYGILFENFRTSFKEALKQRRKPYTAGVENSVNNFKEYAMPELTFLEEIVELTGRVTTPIIAKVIADMDEFLAILSGVGDDVAKQKKVDKIVVQLQAQIAKEIKTIRGLLAKLKAADTAGEFLTAERAADIAADLDNPEGFAKSKFSPKLNSADLYDLAYKIHATLDYCAIVQAELQSKTARFEAEKKPAKRSASVVAKAAPMQTSAQVATVAASLEQMRLDAESAAKLQAEEDARERQIQADIEQQNARAREEGKALQAEKGLLFSRKVAVVEEEEEETLGSTRPVSQMVLNTKNYATLTSIFAGEHNTVTYDQAVNLIESVGGKVVSRKSGGSNRKIVIGKFDGDTFEPTDDTQVGGFHAKHKSGHNDKKLIKPIVQDIRIVLEKAGITPQTCVTKNDVTATTSPRPSPSN